MKKLFFSLIFICLTIYYTNATVFALSDVGTLKLQLKVKPIYSMTIDATTLDFGTVDPGSGNWGNIPDADGLGINCQTNLGTDWSLYIQTTNDFTHDDQVSTMPSSVMQWMCVYSEVGGSKLDYPFAQFASIANTMQEVYNTAKSSYQSKNGNYTFKIKFMIGPVPAAAKPGNYATSVVFTMTE